MNNEMQNLKQDDPNKAATNMAQQALSAFGLPWPRKPTASRKHGAPAARNPFGKSHYVTGGKPQFRGKKKTPVW